jgi:hypothetical protein
VRTSPAPRDLAPTPALEPVSIKAPAVATGDEIPTLSYEERESRTFSGRAGDFQKPPDHPVRSSTFVLGGVALLLVAVGGYVALSSDDPPARRLPPPPVVVADVSPAVSTAADVPAVSTAADVPAEPEMATFAPINEVGLPSGVVGADNATEFARHCAASYHAGTTQRMIATCVPGGGEGSALYLHPMTFGQLRGASRGLVACAGFDLGVVSDVTADGSDDVVAVSSRRDDLLIINSQSLRPHRTIEIDGVQGIAVNTQIVVQSEPVVVVYAEPRGADDPTEVRAVSAVSSRVLWRYRGSGALPRIGHPVELGLAVGPDATGDGVGDVVMGAGPALDTASTSADARRCVFLLSGADGRPAWPQPFCQSRARGLQSVSIGPDVNGDTRADVIVGTDQPGEGEAPVVLLSGVDGTVIRQIAAPSGDAMRGFGWPVVLSGDVDGDRMPDILVGVIGATPSVQVFDAAGARLRGALPAGGVGSANLRVFSVPTLLADNPWSILVADPANGLRVYMRRQTEEAL